MSFLDYVKWSKVGNAQSTFLTCPHHGRFRESSIVYEAGLRWQFRVHFFFLKFLVACFVQEFRNTDLQLLSDLGTLDNIFWHMMELFSWNIVSLSLNMPFSSYKECEFFT
jgi:hypothetical protein